MPTICVSRHEIDLVSYHLNISDYELEKLKDSEDSQEIIDALFDEQDVTPSGQQPSSSEYWHGFENLEDHAYFKIKEED